MSMELLALDATFANLGVISFQNLQWERSYYSYGTFTVQMLATEYDPNTAYVYTKDRPETGIVQKVTYRRQRRGRFILLSGFFLKKILDDKIAWTSESDPTFYANGNIETEIRRMIETYKDDIPLLTLGPVAGLGTNAEWQTTGGELGKVSCERLQAQGLSYFCDYNLDDGLIYYTVWQGKDRTQAQTANSFATFSDEFGNLGDVEINIDKSNHKNYGVVGGEGQSEQRYYERADASGGGYKIIAFIDSRMSRFDPTKQTEADYRANLRQDGLNALANDYYVIENAKIKITAQADAVLARARAGGTSEETLVYRQDFDLGDLCDVILTEIGIALVARIIHVREVIKQNQHLIGIELGEAILTRTEKARL